MSALALAWVLHQPGIDSAVIGPRRPEHIDAALTALDVALPDGGALAAFFQVS
jgi:aryl-alcohol dehydrogenase-like predicted oxidoreductase